MVHISKDNLKEFLYWLENSRNCSIRSKNQRLATFKSFPNYIQYKDPNWVGRFRSSRFSFSIISCLDNRTRYT